MKFVTFEANRIANTRTKNGRYAHLVVMGFSQGGGAAHELVQDLNKDGVPVRLVITADPVHRGPATVFPFLDPFKKPGNVHKWANYYQECDKKTFLFGILGGLKGHSVAGADVDEKLAEGEFEDPKYAHRDITLVVAEKVEAELLSDTALPLGRDNLGGSPCYHLTAYMSLADRCHFGQCSCCVCLSIPAARSTRGTRS